MLNKLNGQVAYAVMSFGGFLGIGESYHPLPDLDSRTGFRHREWQKCWGLIKSARKCGAKL